MAFDLDKVIAENEKREPFTFTFDGQSYTLPNDVDITVIELARDGELATALERLVGETQWAQIVASPTVFGTVAATKLIEAYFADLGFDDLGESSASSPSSNRTARRSKQTSNTSIKSGSQPSAKN